MKKAPIQRQQQIIQFLSDGKVLAPVELAHKLNVSVMTVHRDLNALESKGRIIKEHGGVFIPSSFNINAPYLTKRQAKTPAKTAIGKFAASNLIDYTNDSIIVDSGSTTLAFIKALVDSPIQVMVASVPALNYLTKHQYTNVYCLGGKLTPDLMAFEGTLAHDTLSNCHFTKAFIGTDGIDLKAGLTTTNTQNAQLTRLMADQADEVYLLADLSKFHRRALASIMGFEHITGVITEKGVAEEFRELFDQCNVQLFEVECND